MMFKAALSKFLRSFETFQRKSTKLITWCCRLCPSHYRYQRGNRSLADNLVAPSKAKVPALSGGIVPSKEEEEEYDIPEEIEDVIGKD